MDDLWDTSSSNVVALALANVYAATGHNLSIINALGRLTALGSPLPRKFVFFPEYSVFS